ncbi:putative ABC-type antimicrobial peptide transport system, permease component [Vibrio nigripulchritudo MADA3029]|uniref:ABC transporter permease n=1 Tax=Vibrio nigripulchritudo TaxID=28173 RepID=UPI0003B18B49|nr:ABC transporter permease [Vibrio nigripulchritudo]CCN47263.1 putative ABC-type antimicrobial peptide transport system, permease component [Vibrio nigripulchritudo MADA3020]CCN52533.1 putative ABC-type antimicrobial peptide transport system, permease component [Vibrio nigripulchritudo MADA3021]CCN60688.1 putative ABC-type antimicrobial peptide transport system, permease component [Vibrio nigripulchritudo MADA3029]
MGQLNRVSFFSAYFENLRYAFLNLKRNSRRSALSILIIAIAVFAMVSAGGFGLFTYQSLKESTARDTGHLTLSQVGYFEQDEDMPLSNGLSGTKELVNKIMAMDKVRSVQPRVYFTGLISNGNKSTIFVGNGVNEKEFDMKGPFLNVKEGRTLTSMNSSRYNADEPQVMLAYELARNLKVSIGDWVTLLATTSEGALNALDFKVHGIYSTGIPELDKRQLYLHVNSAQELLVTEKISTLSVFLFDTEQTNPIQNQTQQLLDSSVLDQEIQITPWQDRAFFYKKVKDLYDRIFGIMGLIMALVVFVALFNTMTMSVTERTREIGTLSALGTYSNEIISSFIKEAGLLALIGSLIGVLASLIASVLLLVVEIKMPPPPGHTEGYPLQINFSPELAAYSTLGVVAICVFAAYFSARKGAKKPITEALAYV